MAPKISAREALMGKTLLDHDFARAFIETPEKALHDNGISLSAADLQKITSLSPAERGFLVGRLHGGIGGIGGDPHAYLDNIKGI